MGSDVPSSEEMYSYSVKVHSSMCRELARIIDRVICIIPDIESARPGFRSGIQELCSLNTTIEKAKLLLQHCAEAGKFYLAITGEATMLRCERIRKAMDTSLSQIQNMVPQPLANQVVAIISDLREVNFVIESSEQEAGQALLSLLRQTDSTEILESQTFQIAASKLCLTSSRALLIEKRAIKKLLDKVHNTDPKKESILNYLLYLLRKYGKSVGSESSKLTENDDDQNKESSITTDFACDLSKEISKLRSNSEFHHGETRTDASSAIVPPVEFCCPLSSRIMYDPVVIASGQTYERMYIEKWFSDGNYTCPKTHTKLSHLTMTSNSCIKDLISQWCAKNSVTIQDPALQSSPATHFPWNTSHSGSIMNFGSSLNNLPTVMLGYRTAEFLMQGDSSNVSVTSSDGTYTDSFKSNENMKDGHFYTIFQRGDSQKCQTFAEFSHDTYLGFLSKVSVLPLDAQCKALEDFKDFLKRNKGICHSMLNDGFLETLIKFLKDAHNLANVMALRSGAQMLLAILAIDRSEILSLTEDDFQLLACLIESEIIEESLDIMQILSGDMECKSKILASGALLSIVKILHSEADDVLERAVRLLSDLSSHHESRSYILTSECISKLVLLLGNSRFSRYCVEILQNICDAEEVRVAIAETNGCVASIVELLETGNHKEQEHAVTILYSLCTYSTDYCLLVLQEGVIPPLVNISVNGNARGKDTAMKLLTFLRDVRHVDRSDSSCSQVESNSESLQEMANHKEKKTSKATSFFGRRMKFLSKPLALF
ncbi:U-box domain-containing protein 5 [Acorus calamus]|uniref:RING-type E3 ubiquitin transferase n=1 Tax=Acorus calamus TaxID=4465 RepID=A0AAV9DEA5_ACOCL|nr:U-box domain-containing protein 5 [Acorus calamus]